MHFSDSKFLALCHRVRKEFTAAGRRTRVFISSRVGLFAIFLAAEVAVIVTVAYYSPDKVKVLLNVRTKEELIASVLQKDALSDYQNAAVDILTSLSPSHRIETVDISLDMKAISKLSCKLSGKKVAGICERRWAFP